MSSANHSASFRIALDHAQGAGVVGVDEAGGFERPHHARDDTTLASRADARRPILMAQRSHPVQAAAAVCENLVRACGEPSV